MDNLEYYNEYRRRMLGEVLKLIKNIKVEIEEDGNIPTIDLLIERLENNVKN